MSDSPVLVRTTLYLSHYVWGQLKLAAFEEDSTANDIINLEVAQYLVDRQKDIQTSIHRQGNKDQRRQPRTIRFRQDIWTQVQQLAKIERFSVASLVESLLIKRLGLTPLDETEPLESEAAPEQPLREQKAHDPGMRVKVGDEVYDLGKNPIIIDINGEPKGRSSESSSGDQ